MKILQVTNFFKPLWEAGGVARVAYEISNCLSKRGHEVTVFTTNYCFQKVEYRSNKLNKLFGMNIYYFENLRRFFKVKTIPLPFQAFFVTRKTVKNYDIIHIHEHRTILAVFVYHYAKKHGIPYVIQSHGSVTPSFQKSKLKKIFDYFWGSNILKKASKLIALNETEKEEYIKMGIPSEKIKVVPNGIDLSEYQNLPEMGQFRKKYGIEKNEKFVLYLGRLSKIKGIDLLIQSFAEVLKEISNVKLAIVGPDDGVMDDLEDMVKNLGINEKVLFTGPLYKKNKLEAYVDADVYVLPSSYEIFGITLLEAILCGTPVICTKECAISDFINEKAGIAVLNTVDGLKDGLLYVLNNPEKAHFFSEYGKGFAEKNFNIEKITTKLENLYKKITD